MWLNIASDKIDFKSKIVTRQRRPLHSDQGVTSSREYITTIHIDRCN